MPMESGGGGKLLGDSRGLAPKALLLLAEELLEGRLSSASAEKGDILAAVVVPVTPPPPIVAAASDRGVELRRLTAADRSRLPPLSPPVGVCRATAAAGSSLGVRDGAGGSLLMLLLRNNRLTVLWLVGRAGAPDRLLLLPPVEKLKLG